MAAYDGSIRIDTRIDAGGISRGVEGILSAVKKLAAAVALYLGVHAVASVAKLAAEFHRLSIAAQAVGQMFGVTAAETRAMVAELVDMGIQTDIANKAFINFAREGLDLNLLPALARGAQDLAVFANAGETSSDVFDRLLNIVLTLNPVMARAAGVAIDFTEANRRYAQAAGITINQMSIQEKRQAALIALTEKLTGVTGLYELSQQTAAGQMQSHTRIMNEFKAAMGGAFQDAFFRLIKSFNDLLKAMTNALRGGGPLFNFFVNLGAAASFLAQMVANLFNWIARLFGGVSSAGTEAAKVQNQVATSGGAAAESQEDLAAGIGKVSKASKEAAKQAKGQLAAFDELNVLQQDMDDTGSGAGDVGGPVIGPIGGFDPSQFEGPFDKLTDAIKARLEEWKASLSDFFSPITEAWGRFRENAQPIIETIGGFFLWIWENILIPFGTWIITKFLPVWLDLAGQWLIIADDILKGLGPALEWLWLNVLKPVAETVGGALLTALVWLTEQLQKLHIWIQGNQKAWQIIVTVIAAVIGILLLATSTVGVVIAVIVALILIIANWRKIWEGMKSVAKDVWDFIVRMFKAGADGAAAIINALGNKFRLFLDNLRQGWTNTWSGIRDFVKGIINTIIGFINGMIRAVAGGINAVIGSLNSIKVDIPDWIPGLGGKSFGVNIAKVPVPQIPRLATGAVIPPNAQFAAILGDQRSGRNLEAPEGLIRQIIQEEMGTIEANVSIKFEGTLAAFVREIKPLIDVETVRKGSSLIKSGAISR